MILALNQPHVFISSLSSLPAEVARLSTTNNSFSECYLFSARTQAEDQNQAAVLLGAVDRGLLQEDN